MLVRRAPVIIALAATVLSFSARARATDLIMNGGSQTLGGVHVYDVVSLTGGAKLLVKPFDGTNKTNSGNLVIQANTITIDATSAIVAKGAGYPALLCQNGSGPASSSQAGGRGGCSVLDSGGGGAHFGDGGRGTKDCVFSSGCVFPRDYEEDCVGALNASMNACASAVNCRNDDGLPTTAGRAFQHSPYAVDFGAAGGDKGCGDGDGFTPIGGTTVVLVGGSGGGRIMLFAANASHTGSITLNGVLNANGNRGCSSSNDSGGGGAGGSVLLVGDNVNVGATAKVFATGGRGGDAQPKCLPCTTAADCGETAQTCVSGRCAPCNCSPCSTSATCNSALGQTCKNLGGNLGSVCVDASNQCTPLDATTNEVECKGTQNSGTCDDCGGGGGGGSIRVLSRVAGINSSARFDVTGAFGGVCPICTTQSGGTAGDLVLDGKYVGEVCDGFDNDLNGSVDDGLPNLNCNGTVKPACVGGVPQKCPGCDDPGTVSGTPCDDGNACTQSDACQSSVCMGGNPVVCPAPAECRDIGVCNTTTGVCSSPTVKGDGAPCTGGTCESGVCVKNDAGAPGSSGVSSTSTATTGGGGSTTTGGGGSGGGAGNGGGGGAGSGSGEVTLHLGCTIDQRPNDAARLAWLAPLALLAGARLRRRGSRRAG